MEENDEEKQAKETLLQNEIINKNFDKISFFNFCLSKRENGNDLSTWSLSELEQIVKEFVSSQKYNEPQPKPQIKNEVNKKDLEKIDKFNANEPKVLKEETIVCRKLEKTVLNDKEINIIIKNPKEKSGGIFGNNYILYEVQTLPTEWVVTRRFSDFVLLRQLLAKYFPSYNIPPLPNKKYTARRFDSDFIMKRMKFLNLFINNIVRREDFKASEILVSFLFYHDRAKFESKFKEYQNQTQSSNVEDYKTLEGKLVISHDEGNEKYFISTSKYFNLQTQYFLKLNLCLKNFCDTLTIACENLTDVQKCFDILHTLNTKASIKQTITKTYEILGSFFDNWKKILIKQKELVKNYMKDFYKYVNFEGKAYTELIDRREELKNKYNAEDERVTAKKNKLFASGDIDKFEFGDDFKYVDRDRLLHDKPYAFEYMCKKDRIKVQILRNQLGYANKKNMIELKKLVNEHCIRFVDNIKAFDVEFYKTINDMVAAYSNLETFVKSASVKKC